MISVIIPSRNRYSYILDLLNDLSQQETLADEIIVIDQSDEPYSNLPCTHIIDSERGPCRARNIGLEKCNGEIIVFLDDDIRIEKDFIQKITSPIVEGRTNVVVGAILNMEGQYQNATCPLWKKDGRNWLLSLTSNPGDSGEHQTLSFAGGCSAIHRIVYEKVGGFDQFFDPDGAGEDREYGLRIFHGGFSSLYYGEASVRHLGALRGGRRGAASGFKYQNILEANSVYIVSKYFSWSVFDQFCSDWLKSILHRGRGLNPRKWIRSVMWWKEARKHIENIREIKRKNSL
jgi:GT2 family glycosyltransferase